MFVKSESCSGSAGVVRCCVGGHVSWFPHWDIVPAMPCNLTQNLWGKQTPTCVTKFNLLSSSCKDASSLHKSLLWNDFLFFIFIKLWFHAKLLITQRWLELFVWTCALWRPQTAIYELGAPSSGFCRNLPGDNCSTIGYHKVAARYVFFSSRG